MSVEREVAHGRERRDFIRSADPVERPALVAAAVEAGHLRDIVEDPLAPLAGPLIEPAELERIVEAYSRRRLPDAWERLDATRARAERQETRAMLALEAIERITGTSLREDPTTTASGS